MPQLVHAARAPGEVTASRRRESRRRHRHERKHRPAGEAPPPAAPAAPAAAPAATPRDISWSGLVGSLAGAIPFAVFTVAIIVDPGDNSRLWALPFVAIATAFLPAAWASIARTPYRQRIQKGTTVGCIAFAAGGILFFGIGFAVLLTVPTTLLAVASGIVFQGGRSRK